MPPHLKVGQTVFVPWASLGDEPGAHPTALAKGEVVSLQRYRATLKVAGEVRTATKASLRTDVAVVIVRVGDFVSEPTLLDPLGKSVLHFMRLLLPDDSVTLLAVRGLQELKAWWATHHPVYGSVILLGHGDTDEIVFGVDGRVTAEQFAAALDVAGASRKLWLSLACKTGYADFAKVLSRASCCSTIIAPFHSVHGALASHFVQTFFVRHVHDGESATIAFRHARAASPNVSFRRWTDGAMFTD